MTIKTELEKIAKEYFLVETLTTRNMDSLDFHEVSVWAIKGALAEAYKLGQQSTYLTIFKKE
jgi:reverse gyrase